MSDFLFSRVAQPKGVLANLIKSTYDANPPEVLEIHGDWGSLAASHNLYGGLQALVETDLICIVVGGPVLSFASNSFLTGDAPTAGTRLIVDRVKRDGGQTTWVEDLEGPFAIILIERMTGTVRVVTDLMSFIPVFCFEERGNCVLGTHVDQVARASGCEKRIDYTSAADFVFHGSICYPFTLYSDVRQLAPASTFTLDAAHLGTIKASTYWLPREEITTLRVDEVAAQIREGMQSYIQRITEPMSRVACLLSGGEDSRVILSMLPGWCERDAIILQQMLNRETRIAASCAVKLSAHFRHVIRPADYLAKSFLSLSKLIGSGMEPKHTRAYGIDVVKDLIGYSAVFGGHLSDTFVKGHKIKKLSPAPFIPAVRRPFVKVDRFVNPSFFKADICEAVSARRSAHLQTIQEFRPASCNEWAALWPICINPTMAGYQANRRLFRTYEPFMTGHVVKASATSPQSWKMNRRLFHALSQPLLEPVKWLPHCDGRMPYFSSFNPVHFVSWLAAAAEETLTTARSAGVRGSGRKPNSSGWEPLMREYDLLMPASASAFGLASQETARRWESKYKHRLLQVMLSASEVA